MTKITALSLYRSENKSSRAVGSWTYYGSTGVVRKATCVYCRRVIATCSQKWPETQAFRASAAEHSCGAKQGYVSRAAAYRAIRDEARAFAGDID